jgi:hypothetical protein
MSGGEKGDRFGSWPVRLWRRSATQALIRLIKMNPVRCRILFQEQ